MEVVSQVFGSCKIKKLRGHICVEGGHYLLLLIVSIVRDDRSMWFDVLLCC